MSIKNFINNLSLSEDDKNLIKAGLKDDGLRWTPLAKNIVLDFKAKFYGYKNMEEMCIEVGTFCFSTFEMKALFEEYREKLIEYAEEYNKN